MRLFCRMAALFVPALLTSCGPVPQPEATAAPPPEKGAAVVELFTSQGCSSCPPADRVLGRLIDDARADRRRVYALAFHVDYWDRLGWKDPFGAKAATRRQNAYADALRANQVYTPQMIVNGTEQFVGSDEARARKAVAAALAAKDEAVVVLKARRGGQKNGAVTAEYAVTGAPRGAALVVAFVEKEQTTAVPRGENARRTLKNFNVVRAFTAVELDRGAKGEVTLEVPTRAAGRVIAFVQKNDLGPVVGAADAEVSGR